MYMIKLSLTEKRLLKLLVISIFIQLLLICAFVNILAGSSQVSANDCKRIDIIVEDTYCVRVSKENWLFISSDSTKYLFRSRSTVNECSVDQLYKTVETGDKLCLMYYETHSFFGEVNLIVDARDETEIYRTIDEYNRAKEGLRAFEIIVFSVIELLYVGFISIYVWINLKNVKGLYRKWICALRKQ